jgi:hypothetical protein
MGYIFKIVAQKLIYTFLPFKSDKVTFLPSRSVNVKSIAFCPVESKDDETG